jgi:hypothetical protein
VRGALAFLFYAAALILIYAGFNVPGGEGLNTHVIPRGDAELLSVLLILNGCASKLMGHVMLFSTVRAR